MQQSQDIRNEFIQFFEDKSHTYVKSSSLVPYNDPTLLFTNAGMNQFKNVFLGIEKRNYVRAITSQKCVRAGGKHNDLETVGKTARHHTFFEMLGNFSFGDYFKKEAIHYAWTFLTKNLGLSPDDLWITVYRDDDEAKALWADETGFSDEKILRLDEKDNFWQMGDVGPCGPCSEIHLDRGIEYACDHQDGCALGICDCDRWLEIWNLVFMQFNREDDGRLTPLPNPSVDTGMGLERITSVIQQVDNNWETDIFLPLLQFIEKITGKKYYADERGFAFRVIADHARACTFLIGDGVLPSNEGRGYVLRRILRRAVRLGKSLGLETPFLYQLTDLIVDHMGGIYPEIKEQQEYIKTTINAEEKRFFQTLQDGLKRVHEAISELKNENRKEISGDLAFLFYDTYGFPIDLTKDIAEENNMTVDVDGFEKAMAYQREMSKTISGRVDLWDLAKIISDAYPGLKPTTFTGYDVLEDEGVIQGILVDRAPTQIAYDVSAQLVLDRTPFYAQGGGQVGDKGQCFGSSGVFNVTNTLKLPNGTYVLEGYVDGRLDIGEVVKTSVDKDKRCAIARNHTATHLLHYALREVFGDSVHQAGSLVDADYLRFDFSLDRGMTRDELNHVEQLVNSRILGGGQVNIKHMTLSDAREAGYIALFGEKYDDYVRCIEAGDLSKELCGGTHVNDLAQIGLFKITSESAVSAGVRRIEALTGEAALRLVNDKCDLIQEVKKTLKIPMEKDIIPRIEQLDKELKDLKKELEKYKIEQLKASLDNKLEKVVEVGEIQVLADSVTADNPDELRRIADQYRDRLESGIVVLGSVLEDKVFLVGMRTGDENAKKLHAGKIIKEVAGLVDGKGGGRPDMAQAGGKNPEKLEAALCQVAEIVKQQMK